MIGDGDQGKSKEQLIAEVQALRAEAASLRRRYGLLLAVTESISDAVYVKNVQGRYLMINSSGARLLGRKVDEVVGKRDEELFEPESLERIVETDREVILNRASTTHEQSAASAGGKRTYMTTKQPYRDENDQVIGVIGFSKDVTDRKQAEEGLRETREFMERLLENTPAPIYVTSRDGKLRVVNRAWEEFFELRRENVIGRPMAEVLPIEPTRQFLETNRRVFETAAPITMEQEVFAGERRHFFHTIKFPLRNAANDMDAIGGISIDITERKRIEQLQARLSAILDATTDFVGMADPSGRVLYLNRAALEMIGMKTEEVSGISIPDFHPTWARDIVVTEALPIAIRDGVWSGELAMLHRDGHEIPVSQVLLTHKDSHGELEFMSTIVRDITEHRNALTEIKRQKEILQTIFDQIPILISLRDSDGRLSLANREWHRVLGWSLEQRQIHNMIAECFPAPENRQEAWKSIVEPRPGWRDFRIRTSEGRVIDTCWTRVALTDGTTIGIGQDITERRRAEDALARDAFLLAQVQDSVIVTDLEGVVTYWNEGATRLFGWRAEEMLGRPLLERVPDSARATMNAVFRETTGGKDFAGEWEDYRKDGSRFWIAARVTRIYDAVGTPVGVMGVAHDITDRKRAEKALRDYADRLHGLSRRLVEIQEEERRRLARELHDEIGQVLSALGVNIRAVRSACDVTAWPRLDECLAIVDLAVTQVRNLSLELRPSILDDLGLAAALRWLVDRQTRRAGIVAHIGVKSTGAQLSSELVTACYRVVQEALTNVIRHSLARNVWVDFQQRDEDVQLLVRDDGIGFDVEEARSGASRGESLGLLGMQERIDSLGGELFIESEPGRGTSVRGRIRVAPIARDPDQRSTRR
jgi:PAS domain S-box-containing protein